MKKETLYITILVLSIAALFVLEWARPKPADWSESYSGLDKRPLGCYILRKTIPTLMPGKQVDFKKKPIIMSDDDKENYRNTIFINSFFSPDSLEAVKLLTMADKGKNIFIAAKHIGGLLADSLQIDTKRSNRLNRLSFGIPGQQIMGDTTAKDSVRLLFTNPELKEKEPPFYFGKMKFRYYYFSQIDTLNSRILGTDAEGKVNFISVHKGKGAFFVHTVPTAFTNYYMRNQQKAKYAFKALSYLPVAPTVWDEYYKAGKITNTSPFRYIVSQKYLKYAWILILISVLLFFIFKAKRRQRIIPVIEPPANTTLQFISTIGNLYQKKGNHKDIASKRVTYLMNYINEKLNVSTGKFDKNFIHQVVSRSGAEMDTVIALFDQIKHFNGRTSLNDKELRSLNNNIETFYKQSQR